ncbi:hypothetical protein CHRY9390_01635 [Chryseobacterium aquaeductus]|uniref:Lipoprotein n=1 Tax=Chryseobacterium aquaeductus TaxID=2675056 RepID=A0A9N8QQK6_9FLAO|nr:hypothetical protein [Chryseobacterium aquaeductus]CAA7330956.1 hypothetical protein CHRY9390_01635 [Chryseobacterium potabilaquae]CAD7807283.1 hypothetical protein CHRY9390_01635 [Chryseobacterium aquaeductus]
MVNNIKKLGFILIIIFLYSCSKEKMIHKESENNQTLNEKIYNKINFFIDSSSCSKNKVVAVRYQRYNGKKFIQISSQNVFITDSLFILKDYKSHIIAFYNKEFFGKTIDLNINDSKNTIKKNVQWDLYKNNYTGTGIPCFEMYELYNNKLIEVSKNSYYYNNLFVNPPMLKPVNPH